MMVAAVFGFVMIAAVPTAVSAVMFTVWPHDEFGVPAAMVTQMRLPCCVIAVSLQMFRGIVVDLVMSFGGLIGSRWGRNVVPVFDRKLDRDN